MDIRKIDAAEARECLSRFVASHFRDGREHARFTLRNRRAEAGQELHASIGPPEDIEWT